jgi:O-antigen/teichoic acid export membrane protein
MSFSLRPLPPAVWTIFVQGLDVGAQVVAGLVLARMLGPIVLGEFAFALNLAGLLAIFVLFGAQDVCIQLLSRREASPQAVLTSGAIVLSGGAVFCVIVGLAVCFGLGLEGAALAACLLALAALIVNGGSSLLNAAIVSAERSRSDVGNLVASRLLLLAGATSAALIGSLLGVLSAFLCAALLLFSLRARLVHRSIHPLRAEFNREILRGLWRRGRRIGLGSIFGTVSSRSDLILLQLWTTTGVVGLYGAGYRVLHGMLAGAMAVSLALLPSLSRATAGEGGRRARRRFWLFPAIATPALLLMSVAGGGELLVLLYGDEFAAGREVFAVLLAAGAVQVLHVFGSRWLIVMGREHVLAPSQAIAAAVNLSLNVLWIPTLGALGAARASLAAEVAQAAAFVCLGLLAHVRARRATWTPRAV